MVKKIKTPMSDFVHEYCTLSAGKIKNEAMDNNNPCQVGIAAMAERDCKKLEDSFKWKKPD
jgi:hypothetical protein